MATQIPGAPPLPPAAGMPGTGAAGATNAGAGTGGPGGLPPGDQTGQPGGGQAEVAQQTVTMMRMLDKAIVHCIELFGDNGGQEAAQARELLEQGAAKFFGQMGISGGNPPTVSKTDAGPGFPGGGFSSSTGMPGA